MTPITDYKAIACDLFKKLYGRRCPGCHDYVDTDDGIFLKDDHGEIYLIHRACVNK